MIIVILLIITLIIVLAGMLYTSVMMLILPVYDFFAHSYWGLLAALSLGVSIFFAYASKMTHEDVRLKDDIMDSVKNFVSGISKGFSSNDKSYDKYKLINNNINETKSEIFDENKSNNIMEKINSDSLKPYPDNEFVIDMSKTNIDGVLKSFATALNQPMPIVLKGWANKRLELDIQRVNTLIDYAKSIRNLGNEFLELQADAIFSRKKMEYFIRKRELQDKNEIDLLTAEAEDIQSKYKHIIEERKMLIKQLETNIKKTEVEIDKESSINEILKKVVDNFDNLTPEQIVDISKNIINPQNPSDNSNSLDDEYLKMDILLKAKDVNAKEIQNLKAEIERKEMNEKYKRNKGL